MRRANLIGADLDKSVIRNTPFDFSDMTKVNMSNTNAIDSDFKQTRMLEADLTNVLFKGCILNWTNMAGANVKGMKLDNTIADGTIFPHTMETT